MCRPTINQCLAILIIFIFFTTVFTINPSIIKTCKCSSCVYSISYFNNMKNENAKKQYQIDK